MNDHYEGPLADLKVEVCCLALARLWQRLWRLEASRIEVKEVVAVFVMTQGDDVIELDTNLINRCCTLVSLYILDVGGMTSLKTRHEDMCQD